MTNPSAAYKQRIQQLVFGMALVVFALFAVKSAMSGSSTNLKITAAFVVFTGIVLALNDKYWLLYPLILFFAPSISGMPFSRNELACLSVSCVHFIRVGLHRDSSVSIDKDTFWVIPPFCWMLFVFCLNPPGLAIFGSSTIGSRFYLQILLGFLAFFALASRRFTERDAKMLFFLTFYGVLFSLCRNFIGLDEVDNDDSALTGDGLRVRYWLIPCATLYTLAFSRYPLSTILNSLPKLFFVILTAALAILSGKRRVFGSILIVPFFASFIRGKDKFVTCCMALFGAVVLLCVVAGDGHFYMLPKSATRALAVVFPKYKASEEYGGMSDLFRRELREYARSVIRENPWFGRKGFSMDTEETVWRLSTHLQTVAGEGHGTSGNWHSTWYAYAADFGLPCMVLWLFFVIHTVLYSIRACKVVTCGEYLPSCCRYLVLGIFLSVLFSYTSGHSSKTLLSSYPKFALLIAVVRGYKKQYGLD